MSISSGSLLSITSNGTWSDNPTSFTYQWYRGANPIPSQTNASYTTQQADIGSKITCQVVAINAGGSIAPAISNPIVVVPVPPSNFAPPSIPGPSSVVVGSPITTDNGTWSNNPISFSYQWYSASGTNPATPIPSQITDSYTTVSPGDIGLTFTCQVVATNAGGSSVPVTSNPIGVVPPTPSVNTAPSIPGPSSVGVNSTLTTDNGTWSNNPTSFTYQWYSGGNTQIVGQTTDSYITVAGDIGSTITCQVLAINAGGSSVPATSNPIGVVPPPSFVAVGSAVGGTSSIATSSDGNNWTGITNTSNILNAGAAVAYDGLTWVAVGGFPNTIATSQNGINWTNVDAATVLDYVYGVAHSPFPTPLWVAVGYQLNGGTNTIATSSDGTNWSGIANTSSVLETGYGVAHSTNETIWVAVGEYYTNSIAISSNGTDWTGITGDTIFSDAGRGVVFSAFLGLWVAVGGGTNAIATSSLNGNNWTGVPGSNTIFTTGYSVACSKVFNMLSSQAFMCVAVGTGPYSIAYSLNGIVWTGVPGSNAIFTTGTSVACIQLSEESNLWVAVGSGGTNSIATSSNGISWTGITNSTGVQFNGVASTTILND